MNYFAKQKSFALFFVALFTVFCAKAESEKETVLTDYFLVWEDDFAGQELNHNFWTIEENGDGGGNRELQYYRKENVSIGKEPVSQENCLVITAKKENYEGWKSTSGRLITKDKVMFQYGKIEARVKLPQTADGLWPAFWLMGNDISSEGWPRCGEIDIMEMGHLNGIKNNMQDRLFNGACHWGPTWKENGPAHYAQEYVSKYGLQNDFHLYTMIWDEKSIKMYLDMDKYPDTDPYFSVNIDDFTTERSLGNYFHKPFFILFNLAVGGNFTGILDIDKITALTYENAFQAQMYIDYVKIYQKAGHENLVFLSTEEK